MADENQPPTDNTEGETGDQTLLSGEGETTDAGTPVEEGSQESENRSTSVLGENGEEGESTETKTADEGGEGKEEEPESKAPSEYADFDIPKGIPIDSETLDKAKEVFKKLDLTQEQAQELVSLQAEQAKAQLDFVEQQTQEWLAEVKSNPDHKTMVANAKFVLKEFGNDETIKYIVESPIGNNPGVIKFLAAIGRKLNDLGIRDGTGGDSNKPKTREEVLYPDLTS